ncbi:SGNH/GDSL hydrolase family protein [Galactobacillus timonensis]|uniref:SGNH/GDSL hydrolase family protein n=1 Tax=Galactobacillus timonensis TaxID=2041840 RepID=UPI00240A13CF|nr:SGNH/GDSL hydrolase family protein [Galactobacillus timonensis]MDD6370636.1 SGNH/GDSL hydrolase family protein [Galactobacillus timonensis]
MITGKKTLQVMAAALLLCGCGSPAAATGATASAAAGRNDSYACRVMDYYDYSAPAPYTVEAVDESYYADTLFAGDSRMGSLALYGSHPDAEVDYVTSLNLLLIDTMPLDEHEDGSTLMDVLSSTTKDNIYLLFGINEIRNSNFDAFNAQYQDILTMLRNNNPDVNVYIILAYHPDKITDLPEPQLGEHLQNLNSGLITLAETNAMFYLDTDNGLDENGTIKDDYVWDGLHFNPTGARAFEDYIATHVVQKEKYVKEVCE